jgi:hypothetical protein
MHANKGNPIYRKKREAKSTPHQEAFDYVHRSALHDKCPSTIAKAAPRALYEPNEDDQ